MSLKNNSLQSKVYGVVAQIPEGRVMTYGQIAALCGQPYAARIVGGIAHHAPCANLPACSTGLQPADLTAFRTDFASVSSLRRSSSTTRSATQQEPARSVIRMAHGLLCPAHDLPWHRVVKKDGSLAEGYPGGTEGHKQVLQAEGVKIKGYRIENVERLIWQPKSHL